MTLTPNSDLDLITDQQLAPGLYLVATPIGNLQDITLRALSVLRRADLILCEDTRETGKLLSYYGIKKPLQVYNDFSEHREHGEIVRRIGAGEILALVSDAGMPLLSDPGYQLARAVIEADLPVSSIPGASAILSGLQLSGLPTDAFLFLGFLPTKTGERKKRLTDIAAVQASVILFERAQRVIDVLGDVQDVLGNRRVAVARELTKLFEDVRRGPVAEVIADIESRPIKGEVVVVIDRGAAVSATDDESIIRALRTEMADKSRRDAVDAVASALNLPRRHVYDLSLNMDADDQE